MSRIGVVTVTYNSYTVLEEFLESVWKQTHVDFILYIVDSGSTDETLGRLEKISDSRVRILPARKNIGFAAGSNVGMKMAIAEDCDTIMLLNNDTAFGPDLFQKLLDGINKYQCDMVTPKMLYYDTPNKIWAAGGRLTWWLGHRNTHTGENQFNSNHFDRARRVTFTPFCCVLIKNSVIRRIGYLDERYFVYTEDADYCLQAKRIGLRLWYIPDAILQHKVSSLTGNLSPFMVQNCTKNRILFLKKNLPYSLAVVGYHLYKFYFFLDFLLKRTSKENWDLRRRSAEEGWANETCTPRYKFQ